MLTLPFSHWSAVVPSLAGALSPGPEKIPAQDNLQKLAILKRQRKDGFWGLSHTLTWCSLWSSLSRSWCFSCETTFSKSFITSEAYGREHLLNLIEGRWICWFLWWIVWTLAADRACSWCRWLMSISCLARSFCTVCSCCSLCCSFSFCRSVFLEMAISKVRSVLSGPSFRRLFHTPFAGLLQLCAERCHLYI